MNDGWTEIVEALEGIRLLDANWNDQGAAGVDSDLIESAIELIHVLKCTGRRRCPDSVSPGVTGTVLLEWFDEGTYSEIEFLSPTYAEETIVVPQ